MAHGDTDHLLDLVGAALDEIDDRPVSATARRVARIASMLGETGLAVRLGYELKPSGGHPPANADDTRRLMADPSLWGQPGGPAEVAMTVYLESRGIAVGENKGKIAGHGLDEMEEWITRFERDDVADDRDLFTNHLHMTGVVDRVRHTCFAALCSWERQLAYSNVNERIFERFRAKVDATLAVGAPEVLDQFSAVYRRLREASSDPDAPASEELAQAVTTCRRILKAVADHLLPGEPGARTDEGHALNDSAYKNRLFEFLKNRSGGDSAEAAIRAAVGGVYERFDALDALASKGVHAAVGLAEAEMCAIGTYLAAGELLRLGADAGDRGVDADAPHDSG